MPKMKFIKLPALSIDPRIGIFQSSLKTDDDFFYLYHWKIHSYITLFLLHVHVFPLIFTTNIV